MNSIYTGKIEKKGEQYVGPLMQFAASDPDFRNPPPIGKMPDLNVVWSQMEMVDCNTIKNTIPFFGSYFASSLWQPGVVWTANGKIPLFDVPDVDPAQCVQQWATDCGDLSSCAARGQPQPFALGLHLHQSREGPFAKTLRAAVAGRP
jgi:hypothetical protein